MMDESYDDLTLVALNSWIAIETIFRDFKYLKNRKPKKPKIFLPVSTEILFVCCCLDGWLFSFDLYLIVIYRTFKE